MKYKIGIILFMGLVIISTLGSAMNRGIAEDNKSIKKTDNTQNEEKDRRKALQAPLSTDSKLTREELKAWAKEKYPYPLFINRVLYYFCNKGIGWFYEYKRSVPKDFDEFLDSGFILIIPYDYFSGKTYHLVEELNINDTSGFTFTSDGIDTCEFQFVLKNTNTDENFIKTIKFNERNWYDFKVNNGKRGILANLTQNYDHIKQESLYSFLMEFSVIYSISHDGKSPSSLKEMLKDAGQLVEKAWKYDPPKGKFIEFGEDITKNRVYIMRKGCGSSGNSCSIDGKNSDSDKMSIYIEQLYPEEQLNMDIIEGVTYWEYSSEDKIPEDVLTKTKFIDSDNLYEFYLSFTK